MTAVLFLLRAAILVLLWGFVVAAIVAVRNDVQRPSAAKASPAPRPPAPAKPERSTPRRGGGGGPRKLVITEGALAGHTIPLTGQPITIGRAEDSTITLSDDYVSTHHARLVPSGEAWVVEDLGSTNGTYVERRRISAPTPVQPGTQIRVGKTVLELRR
jgi:pSer/pThr/pTyr-binding forkhead associated (FHA) protein